MESKYWKYSDSDKAGALFLTWRNEDVTPNEEKEGVPNSDLSTVAHEMQHQYDYDQGNMKDRTNDYVKAKRPQEIRAVKNENRARKIEDLPFRTTYGGIDIKFQ